MDSPSPQTYTSQLQTIRCIQNNLNQLKSRIQYLQKQEERTEKHFEKLFESSIPLIRNKIIESQIQSNNKKVLQQSSKIYQNRAQDVKMGKLAKQLEISRSKVEVKKQREHGSFHIRQMSRKNRKIIEEAKRDWVEEKKKKSQLVKMCRMQSRRRIQHFHIQKQQEFKRMKQVEKQKLQKKIEIITKNLAIMTKVEQQQYGKLKSNSKLLQQIKKILQYLQHMRIQQFQSISSRFGLKQDSLLDDKAIELILNEVQKRRQYQEKLSKQDLLQQGKAQMQKQNNRLSLHEKTKPSRRFKSQSMDLKCIYGDRNYFRKS